jgi:4-hydroxy-tetrahydrodipicolinate reductase
VTAIAVHGAAGRMGRTVLELLLDDPQARLVAAVDRQGHAALGQDAAVLIGRPEPLRVKLTEDIDAAIAEAQVVIDFSSPLATTVLLERCARAGVAAVVGTTGMGDAGQRALEALSKVAPVVAAPNFSIGVNVLWALAERAVQLLGVDFDLEIIDIHHRQKVDSPSGTALRLAEVAARARGLDPERVNVNGRSGLVGPRRADEVGVHALRGGDVVGDHTLMLAGPGERVELTHRAHGRHIFARGAVRAAHWVVNRPAGVYDMADVLGIR